VATIYSTRHSKIHYFIRNLWILGKAMCRVSWEEVQVVNLRRQEHNMSKTQEPSAICGPECSSMLSTKRTLGS
jgi:hypothetical protein